MKAMVHTMAGSLRRKFTTWNRCLSALHVCVFTHIFLLFVGSLGPPVSREPHPTMAMAVCLRPGRGRGALEGEPQRLLIWHGWRAGSFSDAN